MIHHGDCTEVMATFDAESVDAIVTDPPYDLTSTGARNGSPRSNAGTGPYARLDRGGFMGKAWDGTGVAFRPETWEACLRVAKPGAYLLAFGGTRTVHRMTCAIEDAGWIIRDMLCWIYASGFPKSRASLKPAYEPIILARKPGPLRDLNIDACRIVSGPTAIMAAWEPDANLCVSCAADAASPARRGAPATRGSTIRKPAEPTPNGWETSTATDRLGTGCSDGTTEGSTATSSSTGRSGRTPTGRSPRTASSTISTETRATTDSSTCISCGAPITPTTTSGIPFDTGMGRRAPTTSGSIESVGRWPSNVLLSPAGDGLPDIFDGGWDGVVGGGGTRSPTEERPLYRGATTGSGMGYGSTARTDSVGSTYSDQGTYSRFFLIPKANRRDREPVLGGSAIRPAIRPAYSGGAPERTDGLSERLRSLTPRTNLHPTVKPTELMRHLVRLVTPAPGGVVLDPFLGSGSTALAAEMEGFAWIGIEREAEYIEIAEARLNGTQRGMAL